MTTYMKPNATPLACLALTMFELYNIVEQDNFALWSRSTHILASLGTLDTCQQLGEILLGNLGGYDI